MAEKLGRGDSFPTLNFNKAGGGSIAVPGDMQSKYRIVIFYRGHW